MTKLISQIKAINPEIREKIDSRLKEFQSFKSKSSEDWFSELCFCILTANSRAKSAINIQKELGFRGFSTLPLAEVTSTIKRNKHRFHNTKAKYIIEARKHKDIKDKIYRLTRNSNSKDKQSIIDTREWIVKNIKGIGYKEASHFLRNTGFDNIAILDRHILSLLHENNLVSSIPKQLNKKNYLSIEKSFISMANKMKISPAKLDLTMWYLKTGKVLK